MYYRFGGYRRFGALVSQFGAWAVGMAFILVLGGWFMPWFSADEHIDNPDALGAADGTIRIKLIETEICHNSPGACGTMASSDLSDDWVGDLPYAIAGAGLLFAGLVLRADRRRQTHGEIGWTAIWLIAGAGVIAVGAIVLYLVKFDSGPIPYTIEETYRYSFRPGQHYEGVTDTPKLAYGAFVTLVGLALGGMAAWRARPFDEPADAGADAPIAREEPAPPKRAPLEPPPRGVETDPFRAPPAPPPIRVVHTAQASTEAPRAEGANDTPGPTLLT